MESNKYSIGNIVTLKAHPYFQELTDIIISGDNLTLPPLMVVGEISKSSYQFNGKKKSTLKYRCYWFQPKTYKFKDIEIDEELLKLIAEGGNFIKTDDIEYGSLINFKTVPFELAKKKSTLSYDDNVQSVTSPSSIVNALLSYLPPVLHVTGIEINKTERPLTDKTETIRLQSSTKIKFKYFNVIENTISEYALPIEILEAIEIVEEKILLGLENVIKNSGYLLINTRLGKNVIVKPKNIANRCGYYYLRAFNYITNKVEEFELLSTTKIKKLPEPFIEEVPKFDIVTDPSSATSIFIQKEIAEALKSAISDQRFLRINYLNRNDQLTIRTVKKMQFITVKEDGKEIDYLIGYCMLRYAERTFRVERVQSAQILNIKYK